MSLALLAGGDLISRNPARGVQGADWQRDDPPCSSSKGPHAMMICNCTAFSVFCAAPLPFVSTQTAFPRICSNLNIYSRHLKLPSNQSHNPFHFHPPHGSCYPLATGVFGVAGPTHPLLVRRRHHAFIPCASVSPHSSAASATHQEMKTTPESA